MKPWDGTRSTPRVTPSGPDRVELTARDDTFQCLATVVRSAGLIHLLGSFALDSSAAVAPVDFTAAAVLPDRYLPDVLVESPGLRIGVAGEFFQVQIGTDGTISIRMSGLDHGPMQMAGICWRPA